tara:strand:+ start:31029 stop:31541 length:513 start_codon:yes stop_codon:yes gene_type:complete
MKYIVLIFSLFLSFELYSATLKFSCSDYPLGSTFTLRLEDSNKYIDELGDASKSFCRESVGNLNVRELELPDDNSQLIDIYSCTLHPIGATMYKKVVNHKGEVVKNERVRDRLQQSYCLKSMVEKNLITVPRRNPDFVAPAEIDTQELLSQLVLLQQRVNELEAQLANCR